MQFDVSDYPKAFNLDRKQHVNAKDAIIDPHQTILSPAPRKDPGYHELNKRSTKMHDLSSKVIHDNQGRILIKIDDSHGLINAGVIGQMTFGGSTQYHSSPFRDSMLYKGNNFNQTQTLPKHSKLNYC